MYLCFRSLLVFLLSCATIAFHVRVMLIMLFYFIWSLQWCVRSILARVLFYVLMLNESKSKWKREMISREIDLCFYFLRDHTEFSYHAELIWSHELLLSFVFCRGVATCVVFYNVCHRGFSLLFALLTQILESSLIVLQKKDDIIPNPFRIVCRSLARSRTQL